MIFEPYIGKTFGDTFYQHGNEEDKKKSSCGSIVVMQS